MAEKSCAVRHQHVLGHSDWRYGLHCERSKPFVGFSINCGAVLPNSVLQDEGPLDHIHGILHCQHRHLVT